MDSEPGIGHLLLMAVIQGGYYYYIHLQMRKLLLKVILLVSNITQIWTLAIWCQCPSLLLSSFTESSLLITKDQLPLETRSQSGEGWCGT